MHYYFKSGAFQDGERDPCYITENNNAPSDQDTDAIRVAYGPKLVDAQAKTLSLESGSCRNIQAMTIPRSEIC
jgi:hypothetical protein